MVSTTTALMPASAPVTGAETANPASGPAEPPVSKDMFLKLLVAQIRNQNPLNPADGIEFISQLAEFSNLEQIIAIRQELEAIRAAMEAAAGGAEGAPPAGDRQQET